MYSSSSLGLSLVNLDHLDERTGVFAHALVRLFMDRLNRARVGNKGRDAIERAKTTTFDAVVLDLAMPGMSGLETPSILG